MSETATMAMESLPPDVSSQVITACQLFYGIPSLVLMVYFLIVLGYKNNYTNSFYRLVQIGLLVNISCSLNSWFATRLEKHPSCVFILKFIESIVPGALTIIKYLAYFYMHMQFLSITAMSIHRMLTVIFPLRFELICSKWYPAIGMSFFIYSHLPKLLWSGFTFRVNILDGQLAKIRYNSVYAKAININAIFSIIYFILILIVGIVTVILITKELKNLSIATEKISKKLTRMALTYCFLYTGILLWSVVSSIDSNHPFLPSFIVNNNFVLLTFMSDIMTLALPYILLVFDSNIRQDILRKRQNPVVSVVATSGLS